MLPKKSEWKTMDDVDDEEEEEEEDEEETGDEENDSEDNASDDEEGNNQPRKWTLVDFIDGMIDEEWSGNINNDLDLVKKAFTKYLLSIQMGKTPLIKEFTHKYEKEIKLMKRHKAADGVEKNEDEIQEAAYDATFESFEQRLEDVVREIYRQHQMEEEESQEEENSENTNGQAGNGLRKRKRKKRISHVPYREQKVLRPLTELELYQQRLGITPST